MPFLAFQEPRAGISPTRQCDLPKSTRRARRKRTVTLGWPEAAETVRREREDKGEKHARRPGRRVAIFREPRLECRAWPANMDCG
jgi:hypothetical protein